MLVNGLPTLNGEHVFLYESLQLRSGQLAAQSVFLDVTGHVFPPDPQLLVVVMEQVLEYVSGLLVRQSDFPLIGCGVNICRIPDQRDFILPEFLEDLFGSALVFQRRLKRRDHCLNYEVVHKITTS